MGYNKLLSRRCVRAFSQVSSCKNIENGIWSNFSSEYRSESLKSSPVIKSALLNGIPEQGPPSLKSTKYKSRYITPIAIDAVFQDSYNLLQKESEKVYQQIEEIDKELLSSTNEQKKKELKARKVELLTSAEKSNPEVLYNATFSASQDLSQPVYRHYAKQKWQSMKLMLLMQRLETMSVIPDTLPTLEPRVDVDLKFPHGFVDTWIEPGKILSSNATTFPPAIKVQEFDHSDQDELYTVLIVNPDTPDLENDSFKNFLHYGISNVPLTYTDNTIDAKKLMTGDFVWSEYLPPVPEKNTPYQRFAVWVFRQNGQQLKLDKTIEKDGFDLRAFVDSNNLDPVGAHLWRSIWDRNVAHVRELYGLPEGRIFDKVRF